MTKLTEEQITKATNWWGEQLKSPKFDNGDNSENGQMCHMMATISQRPPTDETINKFKAELGDRLSGCDEFVNVSVDYDPCKILQESAGYAGIDVTITTFPWKTDMHFRDGKVMVSLGYGAPLVEVI